MPNRRFKYKLKTIVVDHAAEPIEHFKVAAKEAARYLRACVNGEELKPSHARIDASKYIIDQVQGKATQKLELPAGGNNFYFQLILLAEKEKETPESKDIIDVKAIELPTSVTTPEPTVATLVEHKGNTEATLA